MFFAAATHGRQLTNEQFQVASNTLAADVGGRILALGAIPPIADIIQVDVNTAVDHLNLESWNWAGTLGDSFPPALGGLGQDFVQIPGTGLEKSLNILTVLGQNIAGVSHYLSYHPLAEYIPIWKIASEIEKFSADNRYKVFSFFMEEAPLASPLQQTIDILVDPAPEPRQTLHGEDDARQDVTNGFIQNTSTHKVQARDGILDKADFASAQMASMATGGVRPGETQLDLNIRPAQQLSQFYHVQANPNKPDFSLRNEVILNGVSAQSTRNTYIDPLLLDISGEGIGLTDLNDAVLFDTDNSGTLKRSGWADTRTGLLVVDDGSGQITSVSQMFSEYYAGKRGENGAAGDKRFAHGFEALKTEETIVDSAINSQDAIWTKLRVWVDASHDAKVGAGELKTLDELGITQINLAAEVVHDDVRKGNQVLAKGTFVINGATREILAVNFVGDPVSSTFTDEANGRRVVSQIAGVSITAYSSHSVDGATLDATALGVANLYGGAGNDTLTAQASGSWLVGGAGSNTYTGGPADDVFVISASDDPAKIKGNGGRDTALIVGDTAVTLNMAQAGLTIAQAGRGDDVILSGGGAGVFIKGGAGNATLIGGGGTDVLVGGSGHNTIIGGGGQALIHAGPQGDLIYASKGGSIIHAGGGADVIHGREGDDVINVGRGNAVIDGGGGTNLVGLHGNYADYRITRAAEGFEVQDGVAGRDGTVKLRNIQKLNFADISAIDLALPNAMPVADSVRLDKEGKTIERNRPTLIDAASLLSNDQLLASKGGLRIANVEDALGGTATLTPEGDVLFTPTPGFNGMLSFKYGVVDAAGNSSASVIDLGTGQRAPMRATVTLIDASQPDDPLAAKQWYLSDANILPVWGDYDGSGVRIAMFEPGGEFATAPEIFDIDHPDLAANVDPAWLKAQRDTGKLPLLASNHATMVAGVMVAARNEQGGLGVAHGATLGGFYLANKGDDLAGLGSMVNFDVANHSWGFRQDFGLGNLADGHINTSAALATNAQYAAHNGRGGLGTVIVTAGGNNRASGGSAQGSLTNNNRYSIQVAAVNAQADLSTLHIGATPFSNPGASLLIAAPGSNVLSTSRMLETEQGSTFGNRYSAMQGTSFATPIVSGVVALMLQANPNLGYRDVQQILAVSARRVNDPATHWNDNHARNWNGGGMHASHDYGFGQVDARAAVRLSEAWASRSTGANGHLLAASSGLLADTVASGARIEKTLDIPSGLHVEHVEVDFDATVGRLGDLIVRLVSPGGTESLLLDRQGKVPQGLHNASDEDSGDDRSGAFKYSFMTTRDWGEDSAGRWSLHVSSANTALPITLNSWALRLHGREASADDTYFYTDEYVQEAGRQAPRGILEDSIQGTAGGRNTLNAAAVSTDVVVDLTGGSASIGGTPLTLKSPGEVHNLISGDGNDTLTAGLTSALLDGGRGVNTLHGGAGNDVFVVHRRASGLDTVASFDVAADTLQLVGFSAKQFEALVIGQEGADTKIDLGAGQSLTMRGLVAGTLNASHFVFQDSFISPAGYFDSTAAPAAPSSSGGTVILEGGGGGVSLSTGPDGQFVFSLSGTVYSRDDAAADRFVIAPQAGVENYGNALRGYRDGIDKIDLSQVGVTGFEQLTVSAKDRGVINGIAQIHGVDLGLRDENSQGKAVNLLYLDAIEVTQLDASDFIFATTPLPAGLHSVDQLVQAMAAFAPPPAGVSSFAISEIVASQPMLSANWR